MGSREFIAMALMAMVVMTAFVSVADTSSARIVSAEYEGDVHTFNVLTTEWDRTKNPVILNDWGVDKTRYIYVQGSGHDAGLLAFINDPLSGADIAPSDPVVPGGKYTVYEFDSSYILEGEKEKVWGGVVWTVLHTREFNVYQTKGLSSTIVTAYPDSGELMPYIMGTSSSYYHHILSDSSKELKEGIGEGRMVIGGYSGSITSTESLKDNYLIHVHYKVSEVWESDGVGSGGVALAGALLILAALFIIIGIKANSKPSWAKK